jgi:transposase
VGVEASSKDPADTRRGPVLEVLQILLAEGRSDAILELVTKLVARNGELEQRLAEMLSRGKKNEGVSSAQLLLLLEGLKPNAVESVASADEGLRKASGIDDKKDPLEEKPPRQPSLRQPLPASLRRVDNPISVPADERPCPICKGERRCMGHDLTEVIELIPAEVIVRVDRREKLVCDDCEGSLVRAPMGDKIIEGGRMGTTLVAQLLVDKYHDGLPLNRQKQRFERMGLSLSISTLADQVTWGTDLLRPLWRAAMVEVVNAKVMHVDGTSLAVKDRDAARGIKLGALWGYVGVNDDAETALCLYASTGKKSGQRPGELGPADVLALRTGPTVADASNIFESSFHREALIECGCNTHARRYFTKALEAGDPRAALPIAAFKKIYEVEAEVRDKSPEDKLAARQAESKPVYDELLSWCRVHEPHEPPASALGRAIGYLTNNADALRRFLGNGIIPIDNGPVERLHVRTAITRKNYLFAGSDAGAERAAIAYTIIGTCMLVGADPVAYLRDVLPRLAGRVRVSELRGLLPGPWLAARRTSGIVDDVDEPTDPSN